MSVNFATPIAHLRGNVADYSQFENAIAVGRPFRQPLRSAPNSENYSAGLELFLSSASRVADIYAWLDGTLKWQPAAAGTPGDRLILETDQLVLANPARGTRTLASLLTLEGRPKLAVYENVDRAAVQAALETILIEAYVSSLPEPTRPNLWHPSMRMMVSGGSASRSLRAYLEQSRNWQADIKVLVTGLIAGDEDAMLRCIRVLAGENIGRAAAFLPSDPLPNNPSFDIGTVANPNRARRLTFQTIDLGDQSLNALYYLNIYMRQMLMPEDGRIVVSLTPIVRDDALAHPLVDLFPSIAAERPPTAREAIDGQFPIPTGKLAVWHGYPAEQPISTLEWHYTQTVQFEARARSTGANAPAFWPPSANQTNKVTSFWGTYGAATNTICEALQVPAELVVSLMGAEALQNLNPRATRLEPLRDRDRNHMHGAAVPAVDELAYDHVVGLEGNVTQVTFNANDTTRLDMTLTARRTWSGNILQRRRWRVLVGDADRLVITANTAGSQQTDYRITVQDARLAGGFAPGGVQAAGTALYYSLVASAGGNPQEIGARHVLSRAGTLRRLSVRIHANTLNADATVTLVRNGVATNLAVHLVQGQVAGNDAQHQVAVAANDTISLLVTTSGTSGNLRNATFGLLNAPNTGPVWVLEGYSTSVPDQWNGTGQVRGGCTLTWDQLLAITDATLGDRISPGLLQTLISTARGVIPFLTAVWPTAYADLGIPAPPANCRGYLNDWLLTGVHSILLGVAYIRKGYNKNLSRFDLPLVGAAYNAGGLSPVAQGQWGLHYFGDYMANAGPHLNVATDRISTNTLAPAARVRLMD